MIWRRSLTKRNQCFSFSFVIKAQKKALVTVVKSFDFQLRMLLTLLRIGCKITLISKLLTEAPLIILLERNLELHVSRISKADTTPKNDFMGWDGWCYFAFLEFHVSGL